MWYMTKGKIKKKKNLLTGTEGIFKNSSTKQHIKKRTAPENTCNDKMRKWWKKKQNINNTNNDENWC